MSTKLAAFIIVSIAAFATIVRAAPTQFSLDGPGWKLHQADKPNDIIPATVPSTVHTALLAAHQIPNPFYRQNAKKLQWIGQATWVYSRHFNVAASLLAMHHVELRCQGLQTIAHITINGKHITDTNNMFRTWVFDVRNQLRPGDNTIEITFLPLMPYINQKDKASGGKRKGMGEVRVERAANGWDFAPKLLTAGIWRPISIIGWNTGKLGHIGVVQDLHDPHNAKLTVNIHIDVDKNTSLRATAVVSLHGKAIDTKSFDVNSHGVGDTILNVPNPQLWWPNNMGLQHLYDVAVTLKTGNGKAVDHKQIHIGLRTIKLLKRTKNATAGN